MKNFNPLGKGKQVEKTAAHILYKTLCVDTYTQYPYEKQSLGEEMYVINQVIGEYWKPRYLVDEKNKTAVEFMSLWTVLQTVTVDDIDWDTLQGLPEKAINQAKALDAEFPTFIRKYNGGVASVDWELNPDGYYYMDEDGFGMTNDKEITIYGYIDREGKTLVKFKAIKDFKELDIMEEEAKMNLKNKMITMKRKIKITAWTIAAIILLSGCVFGGLFLKNYLYEKFNPLFEETTIFPDGSRVCPTDTTFTVNGIEIKMIGVKGGKINCKGFRETIELNDFYIGETEVTQELWMSVMGDNPSSYNDSILCPVESIDLVECLEFVHKLDSVSGIKFYVQSYPEWLYVAHLGCRNANTSYYDDSMSWYKENSDDTTHPVKQKKPNALGVYDMVGNVSEWTISGSDPLFFVMGGSYETEKECCKIDAYDIYHAYIKTESTGLRLVCYPKISK